LSLLQLSVISSHLLEIKLLLLQIYYWFVFVLCQAAWAVSKAGFVGTPVLVLRPPSDSIGRDPSCADAFPTAQSLV